MSPDRDFDPDITEPGVPVQTELPPLPAAGSRRARRRRFGRLTFVLAGLLVAATGFLLGVQVQKGQSEDSATGGLPGGVSLPAGLPGGGGAPGGGGNGGNGGGDSGATPGGGAGGVTFGQVKLVDGDNVYVTDAQGNTVKVSAADAQITTSQPGTLNDLKPGETVVVQGEADKEGTINATSVSTGGAGGGFPGGGGAAAP